MMITDSEIFSILLINFIHKHQSMTNYVVHTTPLSVRGIKSSFIIKDNI